MAIQRWPFYLACLFLCLGCRDTSNSVSSPPLNLDATYVGDEACTGCHDDLYLSYHQTGMGRSVHVFDPETAPEHFESSTTIFDEASNLYYEVQVRNDSLIQREYRLDKEGRLIHERLFAAERVIGSGNATRSYMMNVNGFFTEMPITWYVNRNQWDLSPGYEQTNHRFSRPINLQCMTCHNGLPRHSSFTQNHYTEVPMGITCERCHGPSSEHVERRLAGLDPPENEPDPGVVNPIHLDRTGQIAVCQQCHLSGVTVFRQNENPTTFRPGQRLSDHRIVYVPEDQLTDPERFGISSHAMRLAQSKCYEQSTMTCTTCHDPHQPVATMGLEAFNTTCRSCHDSASRLQQSSESAPSCSAIADMQSGDCVSCHMQKSGTSDIPHVTFTDHWIRRTLPAPRQPDEIKRILVKQDPVELVRVLDLQDEQVSGDQAMMELEAAIAYSEYYETRHRLPSYLPRIIDSARKGLAGGADHPEARLALGKALIELDSLPVAEHVLREAITRFPEHVLIQYWLGDALYRQGKTELSISHLQAAIELQPNLIAAYIKLAEAQQVEGDFSSARQNLEEALQRDPIHHPEAWNNLGMIHFQSAHYDDAVRSFRQATNLDPDLVQAWVNLGAVYLMLEQFDDAIEVLQFAIESDPNFAPTFGNLGYIYMQQGDFDQARIMFNKVLELQPDDERARAYLDQLSGR